MEKIVQYIDGCRQGNEHARRGMYDTYRGFALKTVFRFIYRYENAVDKVNDGFVKIFNHFHQFRLDNVQDAEKLLMGWYWRLASRCRIEFTNLTCWLEIRRLGATGGKVFSTGTFTNNVFCINNFLN